MKKQSQHLIVISLDALNALDFNYLKELPNIRAFIKKGSYVRELSSVYPTVTYPCHTSIITGTYPDKHGIFSNEKVQPSKPSLQDWYWHKNAIKVPTLFDYAKNAGLKTANVLWPVMASAKIDYNCPEIWSENEGFISLFLKYGSIKALPILLMEASNFKGKQQPYLDNFSEALAIRMIKSKKPNLLCIHLIELDHVRHHYGIMGEHSLEVLKRLDQRIGRIVEAVKDAQIYDNTTFLILGDHGGSDFNTVVYLNKFFSEKNLIKLDIDNNIRSWKVYANSCGGSVHIHVNKSCSEKDRKTIHETIYNLVNLEIPFVKNIYSKAEVQSLFKLNGSFEYVIEPNDGYIFRNDIASNWILPSSMVENCLVSDHGQNPNHPGLKTLLFAKGNKIKPGVVIPKASIVDAGPTMAEILNLSMKNTDGRILTEILLS